MRELHLFLQTGRRGVPTQVHISPGITSICAGPLRNSAPHSVQRVCSKTDMLLFEWRTYFVSVHTFLQYVLSLLDVAAYSMTTSLVRALT
jgi:hypothetical protein